MSSNCIFQYFELITGPPFYKYYSEFGDVYKSHIIKQLIIGLHAISELGIIHCDIKGDNILIDINSRPFRPKYIDFGLAVITTNRDSTGIPYIYKHQLQDSVICFTPRYDFSPGNKHYALQVEVEGEYRTPRTDIYALFVTLKEIYGDNIGAIIDVDQTLINEILEKKSLLSSFIKIHRTITQPYTDSFIGGKVSEIVNKFEPISVHEVSKKELKKGMEPPAFKEDNKLDIDKKVKKYNENTIDDISSFYKQGISQHHLSSKISGKGKSIKYKKYRKLKTKRILKKDLHLKNNNINNENKMN